MPRALWTGTISFGLVNVPVRLYSATQEHDLHFNYVHERDGSRIGYEKICKKEGKPVPEDEIVKAFEWEKGEWVYMSDEDFAAAEVEGHRTIDIDLDPTRRSTHLRRPTPAAPAEPTNALLAGARAEQSALCALRDVRDVHREQCSAACA